MATIQQVADLARVSTATVSRALAGKPSVSAATRERVEEAARSLGYVASATASSLASGRTRNIGMVMPYLGSWFYAAVLKGAHRALADGGYDLTLYHLEDTTRHAERRQRLFDEFLRRKRVDAFIAVSLELSDAELERIALLGKPIVGLGGPIPGVTTLSLDDAGVATLATEHLLSLGHREIAHLGGDEAFEQDFHVPAKRRAAYEQALRAAGVEPDPRLIKNADFTIQGGYQATLQMLGAPHRPTALFAASDEMAIGAILAARDLGLRVPEDLSVVGIDGHELGEFFGLTTVDQFPVVQGRMAAETLLEELSPDASGDHVNRDLPYELVVRKSTAVPSGRPRE
ncbi:LacI family DNA-binding transcriptional regulator [Demequina lignilytica]|uniref:LacI family DNA-binding transcriptional regulator n=1 Tax=Demequina lignilytica TaxID=3051663 RepID=A0AB35MEQ5_9MICO|nr:LacI family DNA-binding transcriptional regulator [Demequina sp. SYSU T0a273]MDN4482230.1 LacI family DNA-binding transcriptional regulator [Demequina sp. SYSU T0a273]